MEAAQADALGKVTVLVETVCRLAVGAGVATGEIAWLAAELDASHPDERQRAQAAVSMAGAQRSLLAVAFAIQDVADAGGPRVRAARRRGAPARGAPTRGPPRGPRPNCGS